eukprot:1188988-Prorocentrum_minimum.AAC.2
MDPWFMPNNDAVHATLHDGSLLAPYLFVVYRIGCRSKQVEHAESGSELVETKTPVNVYISSAPLSSDQVNCVLSDDPTDEEEHGEDVGLLQSSGSGLLVQSSTSSGLLVQSSASGLLKSSASGQMRLEHAGTLESKVLETVLSSLPSDQVNFVPSEEEEGGERGLLQSSASGQTHLEHAGTLEGSKVLESVSVVVSVDVTVEAESSLPRNEEVIILSSSKFIPLPQFPQ